MALSSFKWIFLAFHKSSIKYEHNTPLPCVMANLIITNLHNNIIAVIMDYKVLHDTSFWPAELPHLWFTECIWLWFERTGISHPFFNQFSHFKALSAYLPLHKLEKVTDYVLAFHIKRKPLLLIFLQEHNCKMFY